MFVSKRNATKILSVLILVTVVVLTSVVSLCYYRVMLIQGDSMLPTYHHLQFCLLDVYSEEYSYDDVIAFKCENVKTAVVKRVVALPGDSVEIKNKVLYVNGKESSVFPKDNEFDYAGIAEKQIILSDGEYFTIGDNTKVSKDSRYREIGIVLHESIIGKIV